MTARRDGKSARQLGLFEDDDSKSVGQIAGLVTVIRAAMNKAATKSALSREQILDRMNEIAVSAGVRLTRGNAKVISMATLNQWLNPSEREHVPSILAINVFCLAVRSAEPLKAMLALHDLEVMSAEDKAFRDYGRACVREKQARKAKQKLEVDLS